MEFYTKEEAAKIFRVHPRTIERWLLDGSLKGYKLGNGKTSLWRISKSEVNKFLTRHQNRK